MEQNTWGQDYSHSSERYKETGGELIDPSEQVPNHLQVHQFTLTLTQQVRGGRDGERGALCELGKLRKRARFCSLNSSATYKSGQREYF
jgi:hypothetical protein